MSHAHANIKTAHVSSSLHMLQPTEEQRACYKRPDTRTHLHFLLSLTQQSPYDANCTEHIINVTFPFSRPIVLRHTSLIGSVPIQSITHHLRFYLNPPCWRSQNTTLAFSVLGDTSGATVPRTSTSCNHPAVGRF